MLSKYFALKTATDEFKNRLEEIIEKNKDKKVLVYGAGEGFVELNLQYDFMDRLNIVAISDKKFEKENTATFLNVKAIKPNEVLNEDFDIVLVSNEYATPIVNFLNAQLGIENSKIECIFKEDVKDERSNLIYLYRNKFDKTLPKLVKKLKNKKVVFYGAGIFFEVIKKYFDISKLNVLGISDKKYEINKAQEEFLGYKTIAPSDIQSYKPDYVIVATKFYVSIIEELYFDVLYKKKIKIKPLVKKSFVTLLKEIWNM